MRDTPREVEELSPAELRLRALVYAVQYKDRKHKNHPDENLGEAFLQHTLKDVKLFMKQNFIPIIDDEDSYEQPEK